MSSDLNETHQAQQAPSAKVNTLVGAVLLLLALVLWWETRALPEAAAIGVGPAAALKLVGALLLLLGLIHLGLAWRQARRPTALAASDASSTAPALFPPALWWVLGGFVLAIALLFFAGGFILATGLLFAATARAFKPKVGIKALLWGFIVALLSYLLFTRLLSLSLPTGPLENLIQQIFTV